MHTIRFEDVSKRFGPQKVLRHFGMELKAGEVVALMGPSGSGKTTVARLLMGLAAPDGGRITGTEGLRFCPVFQDDRLCPGLSAVENVALVLPRAAWGGVAAALGEVGLHELDVHKPAQELSDGQKRRVALVRAVCAPGDVLVLDEAFKGLDAAARDNAIAFVLRHCEGRILLDITHYPEEAALLGARVVYIEENPSHAQKEAGPHDEI